ncbi:MAG: OmpA family protein [Bacteroidia bacterium]
MVKAGLYLLFFLAFVRSAFSQNNVNNDSLRLFYGINEIQSENNFKRIDSAFNALKGVSVKIRITGYADFLYDSNYNITLSQKRAEAVKDYIRSKLASQKIEIISCKGLGEKYSKETSSKEGEPYQRRVVIYMEWKGKSEAVTTQNPVKEEKTKEEEDETSNDFGGLAKGQSLALQGLTFEPGRHVMVKGSMPILEKLLKTLQENKNLKIQIQGHVCCTNGSDDGLDYDTHERKLSENRAKAIYDYLVSKGISSKRLSYKGFGHSKPLYPNESTPQEEQANRRVEIFIVEK